MPITTAEGSFTLSDGLKVYTQTWKTPYEPPLAYAFFLHGFSDHCNAYYSFFPTLAERGIEVFSFDQRGWGRTVTKPSERGVTGSSSQILKDIDQILLPRLSLAESTSTPTFLLGHSNGGGIALHYAAYGTYRARLAGVILQSPLIALAKEVRPMSITVFAGRMASRLLPNTQMVQKLDPKAMSRDQEVNRKFDEDSLCHDTGTLQQISDMLQRGKSLLKPEAYGLLKEDIPLLVLHGTADKVTDYDASRQLVDLVRVKDKTFKSYEGWYHKLHAEPDNDKITFANDVADWILARTSERNSAPVAASGSTHPPPAPSSAEGQKPLELEGTSTTEAKPTNAGPVTVEAKL